MLLGQFKAVTQAEPDKYSDCDTLQAEQVAVVLVQVRQVASQDRHSLRLVEELVPATVPEGQEAAERQEDPLRNVELAQDVHVAEEVQVRQGELQL